MDGGGTAAEEQAHRAENTHDIHRLPKSVQHKDAMFEAGGQDTLY
jgi:hypothetical protein